MMSEKDKRLIEENMDKLEVTIKSLAIKFNVPACDFDDYRQHISTTAVQSLLRLQIQ